MTTIHDFSMNTYAYKPITADGYISHYSGKYEINYSSVLSCLICAAGRYCESYASDLFIDWNTVLEFIDSASETDDDMKTSFLFGFRESGIDHNSFVFSHYDSAGQYAQYRYRAMYRLDVETVGDKISMTLGRVF